MGLRFLKVFSLHKSIKQKKMWIFVALFLLTLVGLAYFSSRATSTANKEIDVPQQYASNTTVPPSLATERPVQVSATDESAAASGSSANLTVPPGSNVAVLGSGSFEIIAKGDTGSEVIDVLVDGVKYPADGTFALGKELTKIRFETPRRVDLSNVTLRDRSSARDANGVDTNIRVQSIVVNDNGENVRSRLFQAGRDPSYVSNGLLFWGGDYTFISAMAEPSAQANLTLPVSSGAGTIEIVARGDVGDEAFTVLVDGLTYPSPAGTVMDDGSISSGKYQLSTETRQIIIRTPRQVDVSNVIIRYSNDGIDHATNTDRNIRADLITINGDGVDLRPRLFRAGLDDTRLTYLRNGGMFWGGDYTFV
jgi:hypothetical protein